MSHQSESLVQTRMRTGNALSGLSQSRVGDRTSLLAYSITTSTLRMFAAVLNPHNLLPKASERENESFLEKIVSLFALLSKHKNTVKSLMVIDSSSPLPTGHRSLQCVEELRAAAPDHGGGSVGGVLLQPAAVQPRREHGGGADAVHQQRHVRHQKPAHGGREAAVWDEGQGIPRDR